MEQVAISTPDGEARAFFFTPKGEGPWPGVIFYMDAPAIRPALQGMCERLAGHRYAVLLPDMFWRAGPYDPIDIKAVFADEAKRREVFGKLMGSTNPEKAMRDTGAFIDWLTKRPEVRPGGVACTGYCMGAGLSLRAAGTFPDQIIASAGYHGGRLATDEPDSPHLLAPRIKAKVYCGGADEDAGFPPEQADRLRAALDAAGVENTVEIYSGARHGFAPPDMPVFNEAASERHWTTMLDLFGRAFGRT